MRLTAGSAVSLNAVPGVWGFFRAREAAAVGLFNPAGPPPAWHGFLRGRAIIEALEAACWADLALKDKPMSVQWILSLPPYRERWLHERASGDRHPWGGPPGTTVFLANSPARSWLLLPTAPRTTNPSVYACVRATPSTSAPFPLALAPLQLSTTGHSCPRALNQKCRRFWRRHQNGEDHERDEPEEAQPEQRDHPESLG